MTATVDDIRATTPDGLIDLAAQLTEHNRAFSGALNGMRTAVDQVTSRSWSGDGSQRAAETSLAHHIAGSHIAAAVDGQIEAVGDAAAALSAAKKTVVDWADRAAAAGCTVRPDGHVIAPMVHVSAVGRSNALQIAQLAANSKAREFESHLLPAVRDFNDLDARVAAALDTATNAVAALVHNPAGAPLPPGFDEILADARNGKIPFRNDPGAFHDWWSKLTPEEKDALAAADPAIGNIDGMPCVDRDHYNRQYLARLQARGGPGKAGYDTLAGQLDDGGDRYLLHIDEQGHGALALNNPDLATNVATFVPGTGTGLAKMSGDVNRSLTMLNSAKDQGAPNTSVILWEGYDPPQGYAAAADRSYADNGAPALKSFQNGLRASHVGAPSYNTVVGHSYGTTVIGDAAGHDQLHPDDPPSSRGPLNADNVVFVASPGSTVDHAGDLHLTGVPQDQVPQHVWSTRANGDWIGIPARSGEILDAAADGSSAPAFHPQHNPHGWFGNDVTSPEYGGRVFTSDPGGHSAYWDSHDGQPGQALRNLGSLIANRPDRVH
ncbi:hypothetical protein K7711_37290 [Nocardia sp. CA2R105]|uniref:alpha/beta hydrolase n=1 Tax=Nocardia coffeae TaxID=2873381 RepID=UPI001CA64E7B|nr:alpha/beta hydrolase [Nocardia coffeae]MBY8862178.1 hypothetical protein [Nocardia coffeae]